MDIGRKVYEETTNYGKFVAVIQFYISLVVAIVLVCIGIYFMVKKEDNIIHTKGKITLAKCTQYYQQKSYKYACVLNIDYEVDSKKYNGILNTTSTVPYVEGHIVDISYDKTKPEIIRFRSISSRTLGLILIGVAIFIVGISFFTKYITSKYSVVATATGASSLVGMFRR